MTESVILGHSALKVSRLCLGTVNFGGRVNEKEAHAIMDRALDQGVYFLDTADMYGWRVHRGYTEETIGRWLARSPGRREDVVLATKVGNPVGDRPNDSGHSCRHIIAACEASLRRLGTDWIDLYQLHSVDPHARWEEIWQAMEVLTAQGKIRYVGTSNFPGWRLASGQEAAVRRNFLGAVSEQCLYNLVTREPELEIIPAARAYGLGILVWSPLHSGLLSGVLAKRRTNSSVKSAQGRALAALERHQPTIADYEDLCAQHGLDPAVTGLAWVLSRPGITSVVIGPRPSTKSTPPSRPQSSRSPRGPNTPGRALPPRRKGRGRPEAWIL
ncbi:aldo/keto reductase (plasmid) [Nocardiopsis flavescens]|uniref:LooS12 n=1 Tax=Nocardiopsis flavescens TaxID=758803 RepID=A0A6M5KB63_9ACTN|nr:LooS12 [Nocardiopsis flavescens]QKW32423.1 aldo/keto reductase [Nocardiopsis flavescens]